MSNNNTPFIESQQKIRSARLALCSLSIYRKVLEDALIKKLKNLLDGIEGESLSFYETVEAYASFYQELISKKSSICLTEYMKDKILYDENPFSLLCETSDIESLDKGLVNAAANDIKQLQIIANLSGNDVKAYISGKFALCGAEASIVENLPSWRCAVDSDECSLNIGESSRSGCISCSINGDVITGRDWGSCIHNLAKYHRKNGSGIFAKHIAFVWERTKSGSVLRGVEDFDPISLSDLISYEEERSEIIKNTLHFLNGYPANNILLYGDRGTGKSSMVKAIVNEYCKCGLRIVEVPKKYLIDFPEITRLLRKRGLKFIIFVDDLVLDDNDESCSSLKAVLEGSIETRPRNVVIYATSNRRHLIKERFSERAGLMSSNHEDEVRASDSIQEKLSLSDRFGMTVVFSSPNKDRYLEIVEGIAYKRGILVDKEYLRREALKWELWHNGRSPRTARQFIDWLEGHLGEKSHQALS